ncbi:hypothetical protein DPMN_081171 [Dreissena polymorpha]|uniref:C2H2-type domain-containing protein n=1 Tax=Dreissena polymorpha TaxID=45954 RepID=A0A9D3Y7J5_DREPO|nr:hypothetical protein DPMN_081171 [Dreissena polymorpha]
MFMIAFNDNVFLLKFKQNFLFRFAIVLHSKYMKLENYQEAAWSSASALEDHYQDLEAKYAQQFGDTQAGNEDNVEDEEVYDDLYCVACDRAFKNEKSYKNHEKSKKHKDLVAMIRAHMAEEEGVTLEDGDQGYMEERLGPEGEPDIEEPPGQQRL